MKKINSDIKEINNEDLGSDIKEVSHPFDTTKKIIDHNKRAGNTMIKQVTIFGKDYIWDIERLICNLAYTALIVVGLTLFIYMLILEGTEISLY